MTEKENIYLINLNGLNKLHMNFNDFYWNDSIIKNINIDRSNPGIIDVISIEIDWVDKGIGEIIFQDVYYAKFDMNFGIVASESIDNAYILDNEEIINIYKKKFEWLINPSELTCYFIKTNSTASEIIIFAKNFKVI